jgi:hypothetical protein
VYNTHDPSVAWNGYFKNDPLKPGVYVYRIDLTYSFGGKTKTVLRSGDVTLIQ